MAQEFRWSKRDVLDCTIEEINYLARKIDEKYKRMEARSSLRGR